MIKLRFMVSTLLALLFVGDLLATEDSQLTLVVGNCRRAGGVKESNAKIVEQDKADFTHSKSFEGRVISVDICPLQPHLNYPHLVIDFANTSPDAILSKLNEVRPSRILFEWFPSCVTHNDGHNITPLLLLALKNAFEILAPGGELFIDHFPYTLSLPTESPEAFKALGQKIKPNNEHIRQAIDISKLKEPGIISRCLQLADPFTLHICREERLELRNYLMFRIKNNDAAFDDSECLFIKGRDQDINQLATCFASALSMDKTELMIRISNGMLYAYQDVKEEEQGYWDLFEQQYYMRTRGPLILEALFKIGFMVGDNAIQYHTKNPYNGRRHAWIISAKKAAAQALPTDSNIRQLGQD